MSSRASTPEPLESLVDWLIDGAPGATGSIDVVTRMGPDLLAAGIPVERITAFVSTLHPSVFGRGFRWSPERGGEVTEMSHALFHSALFKDSPVRRVTLDKIEVRARILPGADKRDYPILDELAGEGFTDYLIVPMVFTTGVAHAISFATKAEGGFTEDHLASLRRVVRPLARLAEILALRRTSATLLNTYVGHNSGERILAGRIQVGDYETLRAVIWFSDLRGFTELSSRAPAREVIDTLNRVFGCQVGPIEKHGGEVLKFMGDGLLAIFPLAEGADTGAVVAHALDAASEALAAVEALAPLRIGLALHVGELAYGNIGGDNRLDFTAIGAAVNLAARLEGLTSKLGRPLVVSEALAGLTTRPTEEVGTFDLKGVPRPARVFAPR